MTRAATHGARRRRSRSDPVGPGRHGQFPPPSAPPGPPAPVQSIAVEHWGGTASKRPHFGKRRLSGDDVGNQVRGSGAQQSARQVGHRPGISPQPPMHLAEPPGTTPWGTEPMPNPGAESEVECDLNEQEQELDRRNSYG